MPMKKLLILLLLVPVLGQPQSSGGPPIAFTSVTAGTEMGYLDNSVDEESNPISRNFAYLDDKTLNFVAAGIPGGFDHAFMLHTKEADKDTTGNGTVSSVTTDQITQVCIWHDDTEMANQATWLTGTYIDSGFNIDWAGGVFSGYCADGVAAGAINFGGNCASTCGVSNNYFATITPSRRWVPASGGGGEPSTDEGEYQFTSGSSTLDEGMVSSTIDAERVNGSDEAVSVDITVTGGTCVDPTDYSISADPHALAWVDAESGVKAGPTITATSGVTADCSVILGFTTNSPAGFVASSGDQIFTLTIFDTDVPPSGADRFVNSGATCSDAWDGEAKTDMGGGNGPWCTAGRAAATPAETIVSFVGPATFREDFRFNNPGTGIGAQTTFTCEDGDITIQGPGAGQRTYGINNAQNATDWVAMLDGVGCEFHMDAEGTPIRGMGTNGFKIQKPQLANGDNMVYEYSMGNGDDQYAHGYSGLTPTGDNIVFKIDLDGMGNAWESGGSEFGDQISMNTPGVGDVLFYDSRLQHGGHNNFVSRQGSPVFVNVWSDGDWADVNGYNATDGVRQFVIQDNTQDAYMYWSLLQDTGCTPTSCETTMKFSGNRSSMTHSWIIAGDNNYWMIQMFNSADEKASNNQHITHSVLANAARAAIIIRDAGGPGDFGAGAFKNNIFWKNHLNGDTPTAGNEQGHINFDNCGSGIDIDDYEVSGNIFWDGTNTNLNQYQIYIHSSCGGVGATNMAAAEMAHPGTFHDNQACNPLIVQEDFKVANIAEAGADWATTSGSCARDAAEPLTQANGAGASSTTLILDDAIYFYAPRTPLQATYVPAAGQGPAGDAGCFEIRNITKGWNECIADAGINYATHTIILQGIQTWDDGDDFGFPNQDVGPGERM